MKAGAEYLIGTHDFQSFTSMKKGTKPSIKTINYIDISEDNGFIEIDVNGNGFLLNMVRIIVGTLLEIGKGNLEPSEVENILEEKRRTEAGPIAQAKGLALKEIQY
jgi:tRNA pseudouridine38-40 synthase